MCTFLGLGTQLEQVHAIPLTEATPVVRCDLATAELIKTAANAFLATKISFINAMAQMCQAAGGDAVLLADALGYDSRESRSSQPRRHLETVEPAGPSMLLGSR